MKLLATLIFFLLVFPTVQDAGNNPLEPFSQLVGSKWVWQDNYQIYEWGVGRLSVRAQSYFVKDGKSKLVSEGHWYWHPGEKQIRGVFTAIEMPVAFFDYTTVFKDGVVSSDITTYDAQGNPGEFFETISVSDSGYYDWKLYQKTSGGLKPYFSARYIRRPKE